MIVLVFLLLYVPSPTAGEDINTTTVGCPNRTTKPLDSDECITPNDAVISPFPFEALNVSNMSFCCGVNYVAWVPRGTDAKVKDEEARSLHDVLVNFLEGYNCGNFYPYHSCQPCLAAYRSWVCATLFPRKCRNREAGQRTCDVVCHGVTRTCPFEVEFDCPSEGMMDVVSSSDGRNVEV